MLWHSFDGGPPVDLDNTLTPIEHHYNLSIKRDDLFGVGGGKGRSCKLLIEKIRDAGKLGVVTHCSRESPTSAIVAHYAKYYGLAAYVFTPTGDQSNIMKLAKFWDAKILHDPQGRGNRMINLRAYARDFAEANNFGIIDFGMECQEVIDQIKLQTANIPKDTKRIFITAGSGVTLAAVSHLRIPTTAIIVGGGKVREMLDKYAPSDWLKWVTLKKSEWPYNRSVGVKVCGILLDPIYEAKTGYYIRTHGNRPGDLFWIIGFRPQPPKLIVRKPPPPLTSPPWLHHNTPRQIG